MAIDAELIKDTLHEIGVVPESYSGRSMYGKSCLGVRVVTLGELFVIGNDLAIELSNRLGDVSHAESMLNEIGEPTIDNMGLNYIAYWPKVAY